MFKLLDPVVLKSDFPERGLAKGLLGTVVEVYSPAKVEVEFVTANGRTIALLPLSTHDLRKPTAADAIAVAPTLKPKAKASKPAVPMSKYRRRSAAQAGRRRRPA